MFMFWSKRTLLTRRLLKAKVRGEHETECETQENHNFIPYSNTSEINIRKCGSSSGTYIGGGSCNNCCSTESPESVSLSNRKNRTSRSTICCCCCSSCCSKKNSSPSRFCYGGVISSGGGGESGGVKSKSGELATAAEEEEQEEKFCCCCCCFGEEGSSCCITDRKKVSNPQPRYDYHHHHNNQQHQPSRRDDNNHHALGSFSNEDHQNFHQQNVDQTNLRLVRCKEILKSLKENQLEMLLTAIESYGADLGSCVLVPRRRKSGPPTMTPTSEDPESIQMTPCSQPQSDRNPRCYPHRHHHHHHHHHHHNRRQRQGDQPVQRDIDQEENLPLDERVSTATTTTAATSRLLPRGERNRSRTSGTANEFQTEPHLLFCQIWRWPDLATTSELKRLPVCHSVEDPVYVCCNPYHWSRLCKPESPPPPYCLIADRLRPEDRAPSEKGGGGGGKEEKRCAVGVEEYETLQWYERKTNSLPFTGSLTTNGEDVSEQREWCTLAYWELGGRVGRLYPVEPSTVNVFDSLLDGDGLCLATLAENHSSASPAIKKTRSKIGLGLMLSQESDGVWAYNRSENPIFVNSPTLDDPESRTLLVYRVPPGFCLNIFDRSKTMNKQHNHYQQGCGPPSPIGFSSGPVDVNSVRISFAKGWGPKYSRQEVTSCPCWLEVLLAPCR